MPLRLPLLGQATWQSCRGAVSQLNRCRGFPALLCHSNAICTELLPSASLATLEEQLESANFSLAEALAEYAQLQQDAISQRTQLEEDFTRRRENAAELEVTLKVRPLSLCFGGLSTMLQASSAEQAQNVKLPAWCTA